MHTASWWPPLWSLDADEGTISTTAILSEVAVSVRSAGSAVIVEISAVSWFCAWRQASSVARSAEIQLP